MVLVLFRLRRCQELKAYRAIAFARYRDEIGWHIQVSGITDRNKVCTRPSDAFSANPMQVIRSSTVVVSLGEKHYTDDM